MKTKKAGWEKDFDTKFSFAKNIDATAGIGYVPERNWIITDEIRERVKAFILSTLQKYADGIDKIIGKDERDDTENQILHYQNDAKNQLRAKQRQALDKHNTTYGLKEKDES